MRSTTTVMAVTALAVSLSMAPYAAMAEDMGNSTVQTLPGGARQDGIRDEGSHKGWTKEDLQKLREENPGKFRQVIRERRAKIRARLEYLKQNDPEKYREVLQKLRARRLQRLERLKTENPQKYREIMERRQKIKALLKMRREDPDKFRQYLQEHPDIRDRLEKIRERRENAGPAAHNCTRESLEL